MKYIVFLFICFSIQTSKGQQKKDTLFFKYDKKYFMHGKYKKKHFYLKLSLDDLGSSETFFFKKGNEMYGLKPDTVLDINNYILESEFYNPDKNKNKLDDFELLNFIEKYIIFLVVESCGKQNFVIVYPATEIE